MNGNTTNGANHVKINSLNRLKEMDEFFKTKLKARLFKDYSNEPLCIRKVIDRFDNMIDYNVPHGKKIRGLCAYESISLLLNLNFDDENFNRSDLLVEQALAVSWCIEFVCNYIVYIFDNSVIFYMLLNR